MRLKRYDMTLVCGKRYIASFSEGTLTIARRYAGGIFIEKKAIRGGPYYIFLPVDAELSIDIT